MFLVKLIPNNRNKFKVGKGRTGEIDTIIHSDTLFGAICNNYRKLYGSKALDDFIEKVKKEEIKFSSCFHALDIYKKIDDKEEYKDSIYFFPRPLKKLELDADSEQKREVSPKSLKDIRFVSEEVIKRMQKKKKIKFNDNLVIDKKYLICEKDYEKLGLTPYLSDNRNTRLENCLNKILICKIIEEQKVNVYRTLATSDTFLAPKMQMQESQYFVKNENGKTEFVTYSSFYFLLECGKTIEKELRGAIRLIADEGIGGDRSTGCGLFEKISFVYLGSLHEKKSFKNIISMNLSLVFPKKEDFENIESFNLIDRTSFITSFVEKSYLSNKIRLIEEGGIFKNKVKGDLKNVASKEFEEKNHPVWKYGLGFYLPVGDLNG